MALKPLRNEQYSDISYYLNQTGERGCILIVDTTTSGLGGMDDANTMAKIPTDSGGAPLGMLMNDIVDVDQSRFYINPHQDEVQKNSKVTIMRRGFAVTNCIVAGVNPIPGSGAFYTTNGYLTMTGNANNNNKVGQFTSAKDADGYAKVEINL